jgi:hypothetical protein
MEMSPWSIDQVNSKVLGTISCGGSMWLRRQTEVQDEESLLRDYVMSIGYH